MRRSFLSMLFLGFFLALVSLQNDVIVDARIHASGDDAAAIPVKRQQQQQQQQQRSSSVGNLLQGSSSSQRSLDGGALASDATATLSPTIRNLTQQQSWARRDDDGNILWWIWLIIGLSSCCCCFICWFVSLCFAFMCTSGNFNEPREPRLRPQPHILFETGRSST